MKLFLYSFTTLWFTKAVENYLHVSTKVTLLENPFVINEKHKRIPIKNILLEGKNKNNKTEAYFVQLKK